MEKIAEIINNNISHVNVVVRLDGKMEDAYIADLFFTEPFQQYFKEFFSGYKEIVGTHSFFILDERDSSSSNEEIDVQIPEDMWKGLTGSSMIFCIVNWNFLLDAKNKGLSPLQAGKDFATVTNRLIGEIEGCNPTKEFVALAEKYGTIAIRLDVDDNGEHYWYCCSL